MIENINKFLENNKTVGYIIVIVLLLILVVVSIRKEKKEKFTTETKNNSDEFNKMFFGEDKIINFKCNHNGKTYYLSNIKMTECQNKQKQDCSLNTLVLIEEDDINNMLVPYMEDLNNEINKCVVLAEEHCVSSEDNTFNCNNENIMKNCNKKRRFNHDFNLIRIGDKYLVKGSSVPVIDSSQPTMLNQSLFNDKGVNLLCGDIYNYGQIGLPKNYSEVNFKFVNNETTKVKIYFNTNVGIISKDVNGNNIITHLNDEKGDPRIGNAYVGISEFVCDLGSGKSYPRLSLYFDENDKNVLEFDVFLV